MKREALREAHMRQCIREATKAGHQRIAVVCGAWHVPALKASWTAQNMVPLSSLITDSYDVYANFPVTSMAALQNKKIHAPGTSANWMRDTGATPVEGALTTYYTNIQTGVTQGALSFASAPDFEAPTDAGADNAYEVIVEADDGVQATQQTLTVNVSDTNDTAPDITSDGGGATASINVAEGGTAVTTVVATDAGGPREILAGGRGGLLVPPGDPAALDEAIRGLVTDRDRLQTMSEAARERAHDFSYERLVPEWESALLTARVG